jgi:hypothetical protein
MTDFGFRKNIGTPSLRTVYQHAAHDSLGGQSSLSLPEPYERCCEANDGRHS